MTRRTDNSTSVMFINSTVISVWSNVPEDVNSTMIKARGDDHGKDKATTGWNNKTRNSKEIRREWWRRGMQKERRNDLFTRSWPRIKEPRSEKYYARFRCPSAVTSFELKRNFIRAWSLKNEQDESVKEKEEEEERESCESRKSWWKWKAW